MDSTSADGSVSPDDSPRPLRVIRLYDHLGFEQGVVHGPGRAILRVTPRLEKLGVNTHLVIMSKYHSSAEHFEKAGITHQFIGRSKWDPFSILDVLKLIKEIDPDLIHLGGMKSILLGRIAAGIRKVPVVMHLHDTNAFPAPVRFVSRFLVKPTTLCIGVSRHVCGHARHAFRIPEDRIRTLYNGVNLVQFHPPAAGEQENIRRELGIPEDALVAGLVGRLHPEKSVDLLVEALGILAHGMPKLHGLIIGDGSERPVLEKQAQRLGVDKRLTFVGQRDDMPRVIRALDVLTMPTRAGEGFPNAALEALASGIPVIGSRYGGLLEVVEQDVNGLFCEPGDGDDLAKALRRYFTEPDVRTVLIQNARKSVSGNSAKDYAGKQKFFYEEALQHFSYKPRATARLGAMWRKNVPEAWTALRGGFPKFVFARKPADLSESIPIFCYHRLNETPFEADLKFLVENGYRTATADEVLAHRRGTVPLAPNTVALTFDDGLADLYTVAYPMLKAAGLKGIAFVCPAFAALASAEHPYLCTPDQLREMDGEKVVDVQSHTMSHRQLPTYPREANLTSVPAWWQHRYRPEPTSVAEELTRSKALLEIWLNKTVNHLCLVQYAGSPEVITEAKDAGYDGFWWGALAKQRDNLPGKNPDRMVRISGEFVRRLPGTGRTALSQILKARYG